MDAVEELEEVVENPHEVEDHLQVHRGAALLNKLAEVAHPRLEVRLLDLAGGQLQEVSLVGGPQHKSLLHQ